MPLAENSDKNNRCLHSPFLGTVQAFFLHLYDIVPVRHIGIGLTVMHRTKSLPLMREVDSP